MDSKLGSYRVVAFFNVSLLVLTLASDVTINTSDLVALAAILMSRFMLHLRQTIYSKRTLVQTTRSSNSLMGNMGEYLDDDSDNDSEDELIFETAGGVQDPTRSISDSDFVP
ncbi:uncharacterized protein B0H18DRAFT_984751 [Fomitopsis serialis]|uniref:uncharacterized protein n=1 Tax=Fomitopsis serialis TaxID=139415 RepID=UPI0020076E70|nr:uncharacterized protein B0H18DRAFT_984751 [Neoantrodia serialis]KAH9932946.1 hypothetical protein B0H18DRAFT_984751 [Neoantrodia serialis]